MDLTDLEPFHHHISTAHGHLMGFRWLLAVQSDVQKSYGFESTVLDADRWREADALPFDVNYVRSDLDRFRWN
jgi:hypothetical protein